MQYDYVITFAINLANHCGHEQMGGLFNTIDGI